MAKVAVPVHCDTFNAFSTHSCRATAEINIKMVIQKVERDPEQNLLGSFDDFKINSGILQ